MHYVAIGDELNGLRPVPTAFRIAERDFKLKLAAMANRRHNSRGLTPSTNAPATTCRLFSLVMYLPALRPGEDLIRPII